MNESFELCCTHRRRPFSSSTKIIIEYMYMFFLVHSYTRIRDYQTRIQDYYEGLLLSTWFDLVYGIDKSSCTVLCGI